MYSRAVKYHVKVCQWRICDMQYAPIALFTYNRADHTRQAVESLLKNEEAKYSELFIFSDGAKTPEKQKGVDENRAYIHTVSGFKSVTIIEREKNWGLANSLIAGITEIVNKYGRVIVVEDDLILSPYFLQFMNEALEKYKEEDRVSAISGFLNPVGGHIPNTFFLNYFACWGWATWKRSWELLNEDANDLLKRIRWKVKHFDFDNVACFYGMLYCQKLKLIDSWAIRFYATSYLLDKLVLYPGKSLTKQSGRDGSGTHSKEEPLIYVKMQLSETPIILEDIKVKENKKMYESFRDFYKLEFQENLIKRQVRVLKSFVRRLLGLDFD